MVFFGNCRKCVGDEGKWSRTKMKPLERSIMGYPRFWPTPRLARDTAIFGHFWAIFGPNRPVWGQKMVFFRNCQKCVGDEGKWSRTKMKPLERSITGYKRFWPTPRLARDMAIFALLGAFLSPPPSKPFGSIGGSKTVKWPYLGLDEEFQPVSKNFWGV